MVITKLKGGLGNQMFQYAFGRAIACIHGVPLKLDLTWFRNTGNDTPRKYELNHFNVMEMFASNEEIKEVLKERKFINKVSRVGKSLVPFSWRSYVSETNPKFDENKLNLRSNVYLEGVWWNERYFKSIETLIKKEFQLKDRSDETNMSIAEKISSVNSIGIHVRRGDYVSNQKANEYHGLCSLDYYLKAIAEIERKVMEPHFFLFSDDPQWLKDNLKIKSSASHVIHNSPNRGYEDLKLMSLCKHNIIANSSFSWWAAWLNANPDKIIYAPSKWSNNGALKSKDCLPEHWITI